jgi:isocitrate/isopropylmalate dehydrogenase
MSITHRIAVMGGDGVGPELVEQAVRVLGAVSTLEGFDCDLVELPNSAEHYRRTGVVIDAATFDTLRSCESLLFGAAGVDELPGIMERGLILDLSRELDLSLGVRTFFLHDERLSPLRDVERGTVDCAIVRDTTEGELTIKGGALQYGSPYEATASLVMHTRRGVERTLRFALDLARRRRHKVSLVVQSNALGAQEIWPRVLDEIVGEYGDVETELLFPDHAAMRVVTHPSEYDVIVTTLMLGGILTDLIAGTIGGVGLIGSSRINPETGFGMFEPAHGSAPKYAGMDVVSPMATLNALAMLLDNIGEERAGDRVRAAIDVVVSSGEVPDLTARSGVGTTAATDAVLRAISEAASAQPSPA